MIVYVTPETKTQVTNYMLVTVAFLRGQGKVNIDLHYVLTMLPS